MSLSRKPTMHDVARIAGVGTMTVSRVLNSSAGVSPKTAKKVHQAIEKLGYRPNEMARALRGLKSRAIGVIVPYLSDPFFATCAHAIHQVAKQHGYSVLLTTSDEDGKTEFDEALQMLQRHVEGMIVIPAEAEHSRLLAPDFAKTSIVVIDRPIRSPLIDSVLVQNKTGSLRAVEHLIGHGHKNIFFAGLSKKLFTIRSRYEGYRRAMQNAGLELNASFSCTSRQITLEVMRKAFAGKAPPTAVYTSNDLTTRYVLQALGDLCLKVPDQIAIIGFDDFELAEVLQPTLTVVRQPAQKVGRVAAELLFAHILKDGAQDADDESEQGPESGKRIVLPVELIIRRSCGCETASQTYPAPVEAREVPC
jgi:LacI family transcriptional regulator